MSARWACTKRLAEILSNNDVLRVGTVTPVPPGDQAEPDKEFVFCVDTTGTYVPGPSVTGRLVNDDEFTIRLRLYTSSQDTVGEAMDRLEEMATAVYGLVSDSGNLDALETDDWSVTEARPGSFETTAGQGPEAWAAAILGIDVEVRHYGGNR